MKTTLKQLYSIFNRKQKTIFGIVFFISFIGSLLELLGVSILVPLMGVLLSMDEVISNELVGKIMDLFNIQSVNQLIIVMLAVVIVIYVIKNAYIVFMNYYNLKTINNMQKDMESQILAFYLRQTYLFHTMTSPAAIERTIVNDMNNVFGAVTQVSGIVSDLLTSIFLVAFLVYTSSGMTITVVAMLLVFMFFYVKVFRERLTHYGEQARIGGEYLFMTLSQSLRGIKEVKVYKIEKHFINEYYKWRSYQLSMVKRVNFLGAVPRNLLECVCVVGVLGVIMLRVNAGTEINTLIAQLTVFAVAAYKLMPTANKLTSEITAMYSYRASIEAVSEALASDSIQLEAIRQVEKENEGTNFNLTNKNIELRNVSFSYAKSVRKVLDGINLEIKQGESVAFKGSSGAGKTTIADIILGILEPAEGAVTYGGIDIKVLGNEWNKHLGYIPQNIFILNDTVRANVAFGNPNADDEMIWNALEQAQLKDFIMSHPEGLDLELGEMGVRLSGGQRQRIGIARALYNNPDILVLDEATSALDNETEEAVMDAINYLKGVKTLIIIAHRLSTLEKCDKIYCVDNGKLIQER